MQDIRIPDIGDAQEVLVIELCVSPGDTVAADDALIVIESDKASMEVPAGVGGVVESLLVAVDDPVVEGQAIARIDPAVDADAAGGAASPAKEGEEAQSPQSVGAGDAAEAPASGAANFDDSRAASARVQDARGRRPSSADAPAADMEAQGARAKRPDGAVTGTVMMGGQNAGVEHPHHASGQAEPTPDSAKTATQPKLGVGAQVYAGPATRRLARELGVRLAEVTGTGARGRIVKDDVKRHVKRKMTAPPAAALPRLPEVDFTKFGPVVVEPLSRIRAAGAQNLLRSWLNLPHVTQHEEVDVTTLEAFRASLKAEAADRGLTLSPLPFLIKACCATLRNFPTFNASLDGKGANFILKRYYNIGMAVDTEQGLVVPVIKNADRQGIWELAAQISKLAGKARNQRLAMGDMQGGTFSISSLGAIGGTGFTPIINAPEVAILGIGRLATKSVWDGAAFQPGKVLHLSLSFDHRAINGAEAGRFLAHLAGVLGDPRRLSL